VALPTQPEPTTSLPITALRWSVFVVLLLLAFILEAGSAVFVWDNPLRRSH